MGKRPHIGTTAPFAADPGVAPTAPAASRTRYGHPGGGTSAVGLLGDVTSRTSVNALCEDQQQTASDTEGAP